MATEEAKLFEVVKENFLCCSVCSERYKSAKILPCVHTFCEGCLRKIVKKSGGLTCPICRRSHELPVGGVSELSANLFVNQLAEEFDKRDEKMTAQKKCEACENAEVTERCVDCSVNLCGNCSKAHRFLPVSRSHRLIAIDEYKKAKFNNPATVRSPAYCSEHHDNQIKLYCDTCELSICLECTVLDHPRPEHKFRYLDEAAAEYKKVLTKMTRELHVKENEASESKAAVQTMTESVDSRFQEQKLKVKIHMEKIIEETSRKIRETGEDLLKQLKTEHEERKTNLQAQLKELECTENDIAATREYSERLMQFGSASQLMSHRKSMASQIGELLELKTNCEPVEDDYVEFRPTENVCEPKTLGTIMTAMASYELCDVPKYLRVGEQMTVRLRDLNRRNSRHKVCKVTGKNIEAVITTPNGKTDIITVTDNNDGTFLLTNTLQTEGQHELSLSVDGKVVQDSPAKVTIGPKKGMVRTFGGVGSGSGQLRGPRGVTMTKNGCLIVGEEDNNRLQSFNLKGKHQAIYKFTEIGNFKPRYSTVSEDGNIFTTDGGNNQVVVCDENGKLIRCFGKGDMKSVYGIAISPYNGYVYVVDDNASCCIRIYSQGGKYIKSFGAKGSGRSQFNGCPWGITVDSSDGKVFVSDAGGSSVKAFNSDGGYLFSFGPSGISCGELNFPEGICTDQHGNLYVCDYNNKRVLKFSSYGAFVCQVDCGEEVLEKPVGVCVTGGFFQRIVIVEQGAKRIRVVEL